MGRTIAGLVAAVALAAGPLAAQEQPADTSGGMGMMQGGMMQGGMMQMMQGMHGQAGMMGGMMGMAGGPALMLRLQESLELSEDQVERLEALRDSAQAGMHSHMMQAMQSVSVAGEVLAAPSPDLEAYEAALREAADHVVVGHTVAAQVAVHARQVLNAEQRERLDLALDRVREMGSGMGPGPMMPGMGPGAGGEGGPHR
jgi:Spy/CpxP family protein refolding chaperone